MTRWLATYGASAALLSGGLFALGTVVLVLFYALEAPTVLASGNSDLWTPLGRTNDLLVGLSGLAAIPLAARVHDRWRTVKPWASVVVYAVALAAMLGIGVFGLISFTNLVPLTALGPFAVTALAGIGLWQLVVSLQSAEPAIHGRLRTLGLASGIGFLLARCVPGDWWVVGHGQPSGRPPTAGVRGDRRDRPPGLVHRLPDLGDLAGATPPPAIARTGETTFITPGRTFAGFRAESASIGPKR
jgi:hypothetical protein